jgi:hypothetical protein
MHILYISLCLCICVYICMYVCMCVCIYMSVYTYACVYVCVYVCAYVCLYVFMWRGFMRPKNTAMSPAGLETKNYPAGNVTEGTQSLKSRWTRNQESLCWRGPAANYLSVYLSVLKWLRRKVAGRQAMLGEIKHSRGADTAGRWTNRRSVLMSLITARFPARSKCAATVSLAARDLFLVFASGN